MKKYLLLTACAFALIGLPACTTVVDEDPPRTTSTTHTETHSLRTAPVTDSSTTVRTYR